MHQLDPSLGFVPLYPGGYFMAFTPSDSLTFALRHLGITQRDLAHKAGLHEGHLSRISAHKVVPGQRTREKIAAALRALITPANVV